MALTLPAATAREADATRTSLSDSVYARLKADIFEFRLLPGDRFTENQLAVRLAVSRTPVREALFRLEREGYLQVHYRSGWSVRPLDFEQFDHLYDFRIVIECAAAKRLCDQLERPQLEPLKALWLIPTEERESDGAIVARIDEAFHAELVAAAGNPEMLRCHEDLTERMRIIRRLDFTESGRIAATYQEHGQILRAVLRRRVDQAQLLLRTHIETSKSEVRKISLHKLYAARQR